MSSDMQYHTQRLPYERLKLQSLWPTTPLQLCLWGLRDWAHLMF